MDASVLMSQTMPAAVSVSLIAERNRKRASRSGRPTKLLVVAAFVALLAYALYVPLPEKFASRALMSTVDATMRVLYHRPVRWLWLLGLGPWHQIMWTRAILDSAAVALAPVRFWDDGLDVRDEVLAGVPVRLYLPRGDARKAAGGLVFVHGGGFNIGTVDGYDDIVRHLAIKLGAPALSVDYRLAPEHRYPAAIDDVEAVVSAVLFHAHGVLDVDPSKIVLMGDSAGGNLVASVSHRLRNNRRQNPETAEHLPEVAAQVLLYPLLQWQDFRLPSYEQYWMTMGDTAFLDPPSIARALLLYLGAEATNDAVDAMLNNQHSGAAFLDSPEVSTRLSPDHLPSVFKDGVRHNSHRTKSSAHLPDLQQHLLNSDVAPLVAKDVSELPDAFVATCEFDVLRDEGYLYARALRESGNPVVYRHYEDGFHAMLNLFRVIDPAARMIDDALAFTRPYIM